MIRLTKVVSTCSSHPAQWDAWDADGQYYYLRYRSHHGTVNAFEDQDWAKWCGGDAHRAVWALDHPQAEFRRDSYWDSGIIELDDFCRLAGIELAEDCEVIE